jgi:hypothetical protein
MMKKLYALLIVFIAFTANEVNAQAIYLSNAPLAARFNAGLGVSGTPVILFDDIQIPNTVVADGDSIGFTNIKVGLRRGNAAGPSPAITVNVYLAEFDPTSVGFDSMPAVPPTLIGTFNLPAYNGTASILQILSIGDSVNVFKSIRRDTSNLFGGFQTAFIGVSFSDASTRNGWHFATGPDANFDAAWTLDTDDLTNPRTAFNFGVGSPAATFYSEVYGRPVYAAIGVDAKLSNVTVPEKTSCYQGNQSVAIQIQNTGTNPIAAGAASVTLDVSNANTGVYNLTNPAIIPPNGFVTLNFNNVVIDNPGLNIYTASVALAGDARPTNDTFAIGNFTATTINTFPATDDAEVFLDPILTDAEVISGGNILGYVNDIDGIVLANRSFNDTLRAHSGSGFYVFDGFNNTAGTASRLYTNCIRLGANASGGGSCNSSVSFWLSNDSSWADFGDDSLYVSVSTDKGITWTRLAGFSTLDLFVGNAVWAQQFVDLSAYNGQTIQIGFEGVSGFRQFFGLDDIEVFSDCVLPVTLSKFSVQKQNKANRLSWTTTQEINSMKFVIQQSRNGRDFVTLGEVAAAGTSNIERTYSFTHNLPLSGYNYYRINMVDRDNKSKFSQVRSVQNLGVNQIQVTPNPVASNMKVSINAEKSEVATIMITDMSGKAISSKNFNVSAGDNDIPVNTAGLASGSYIVRVQLNGDVQVSKFIKL